MRRALLLICTLAITLGIAIPSLAAGKVAIYTGTVQWISKQNADAQAQTTVDLLSAAGVDVTWYSSDGDMDAVADWVSSVTGDGGLDFLILYGDVPPTIYPEGNAQPDGSIVETYIETTDGDAVINHADYMFWGLNGRNQEGGLQNIMDIPGITMWDDNTPMTVTAEGAQISPTLAGIQNLESDRPFHLDQLAGDWFAEIILAQNAAGTRADPVIVRDGDRGRLIPVIQTNAGGEPHGAIDAELITWMLSQTTAVSPRGKASVTWGALKSER
ncbi:MAG: hypothetical protein KatS3mg115_0259 [Candidatus Poribacteria bacterium]|nr:MAG: hypothetical protein KatS3mg115_0259 [Candidatus Poribacteria bacterium]